MSFFRSIFLGCMLFIIPMNLSAHPHVWIESSAQIDAENGTLKGFWAEWLFDEIFSNILILDYPADKTGKFSSLSIKDIKTDYFDNLSNFHYFCYVYWNGKQMTIPKISQFQATIVNKTQVMYRFFVPINRAFDSNTSLILAMYDDSFYTDFSPKKADYVTLTGASGIVKTAPNPKHKFWPEQIPLETTIKELK
jgi:ABC-type uncharacterized transport system substrate-binding protein